jgi:glycosyltransferase involved in cell wall biosynthesis
MRIVLAVHMFLPRNSAGTEVLTCEIARRLLARGHQVHVVTAEPVEREEAPARPAFYRDDFQGIPVFRIKHHAKAGGNPVRNEYANEAHYGPMKQLLAELRPEVVHFLHAARLSVAMIHAARDLDIPVIYTATDFWAVCPTCQLRRHDRSMCRGPDLLAGNCVRCYASRTQPALVQAVVNNLPRPFLWLCNLLCRLPVAERFYTTRCLRALGQRAATMRAMLRRCDRIIAPTQLMHDMLARNGAPADRLVVSHYGLNTQYTQGHTDKTPSPTLRFAFIGALAEHKGAHLLVQAFRKLLAKPLARPVELQIWGDPSKHGDYGSQLSRLAEGLPAVRFCGTFPNQEIGAVFDQIDLLVVPSVWYENTPLVIYSAFATKTPVIATDLGGMAEVVRHEVNGLLFPLGNSDGLADQLRRLVEEPDLLRRLRQGIGPVKTTEEDVEELESLYRALTRKRPLPLAA